MTINPTYLAQRTRSSVNWSDAKHRVIKSYRDWMRAAPEIQSMYSLNMPVSNIRTKIRQEFERHRYVAQLNTVDVLLFNSHQEYQVCAATSRRQIIAKANGSGKETLNYWKQLTHVLKYFRAEEDPKARLPQNFIQGFLEGRN
ncbi:hypothetical protein M8818_002754 [Zalaria obscura]|uniref:Uncharacterized protein n=1 Tax=Zalaria obscura TaxID=2024903 RepID=A0ACC3SGS4_9PEZI